MIAVIIATRGEAGLRATLRSIAAQTALESIATVALVGKAPPELDFPSLPLEVFHHDEPLTAPVARNIALRAITADSYAFIDSDCVASPLWLEMLLHQASDRSAVGGGMVFPPAPYWSTVHNVSCMHEFHVSAGAGSRLFLPTANLLVPRRVLDEVGLMDETLRRGQDREWTERMARAGFRLWFEPRAQVAHYPERSLRTLWRDYWDTGYSSRRMRGKQPFPAFLAHRPVLRLLAPAIAVAATVRVFRRLPMLRYLATAPGVFLTKLAWTLGAAAELGKGLPDSRMESGMGNSGPDISSPNDAEAGRAR